MVPRVHKSAAAELSCLAILQPWASCDEIRKPSAERDAAGWSPSARDSHCLELLGGPGAGGGGAWLSGPGILGLRVGG